jgi:hypothetical protein
MTLPSPGFEALANWKLWRPAIQSFAPQLIA